MDDFIEKGGLEEDDNVVEVMLWDTCLRKETVCLPTLDIYLFN